MKICNSFTKRVRVRVKTPNAAKKQRSSINLEQRHEIVKFVEHYGTGGVTAAASAFNRSKSTVSKIMGDAEGIK